MRRKLDRPTYIYWLFDTRPEKLTEGWPKGEPIYCGKTVESIRRRFRNHLADAPRYPHRPLCRFLSTHGEHVHIELMETVPTDVDWVVREKHWIRMLRHMNQHCFNVSEGGQGSVGYIPSIETRIKLSVAKRGRPHSEQHRRRLAAAQIGRVVTESTREKMRLKRLKEGISKEHSEAIAAANRRRIYTPEYREKLRQGQLRRYAKAAQNV